MKKDLDKYHNHIAKEKHEKEKHVGSYNGTKASVSFYDRYVFDVFITNCYFYKSLV